MRVWHLRFIDPVRRISCIIHVITLNIRCRECVPPMVHWAGKGHKSWLAIYVVAKDQIDSVKLKLLTSASGFEGWILD